MHASGDREMRATMTSLFAIALDEIRLYICASDYKQSNTSSLLSALCISSWGVKTRAKKKKKKKGKDPERS